uniref:Retrotransposon gag domain-containing protein n=1 Tax=Fagus sylvatica TaxID=28930 RepID=A0A2N9FH29_FAGSY
MLAKQYSSPHGTREYQLLIEQYQIRQDPSQSINDFFACFQFIWDQLDLADPPWDTPNDAMKYATRRDQMHLYQFLMALHDDYEPVYGQLLHQIPTPSLNATLNELVCEETRLQTLQAQNKLNVLATTSPLAPLPQSDFDYMATLTCFRRNRSIVAITYGDPDKTSTAAVASAHSRSTITLTTDQLEDIIAQALVRDGNASSSSTLSVLSDPRTGQELGTGCKIVAKAIVRNPSLLTYDFHNIFKPAIALYDEMGVSGQDLIPMLLSRPTMIPRTSFDEEKMEYICKTGISKESKMYKYVVTLIGVSRHETIRRKVANLEKFGFSDDEIFNLFGRSPLMLTLSVDKVQRNMTFILGMMKFPASVVLQYPFLLYSNLEAVLRPRVLLARKIQDMGLDLQIKGPKMMTALRMTEKRFLEAFVKCHPRDVADELMAFYTSAKGVKRIGRSLKEK